MELSPETVRGLQGVGVGLIVGALVRLMKLPIPAPPTLWAAFMVVALTAGYVLMGWVLERAG